MFVGDLQKFVHTIEEACGILLPGEVVEENAHRVHAEALRPRFKFAVDGREIEGVGLPHFEFVDGGAGDEIAADQPGLLCVPVVGVLRRPLVWGGLERGRRDKRSRRKIGRKDNAETLRRRGARRSKGYFSSLGAYLWSLRAFYWSLRARISLRKGCADCRTVVAELTPGWASPAPTRPIRLAPLHGCRAHGQGCLCHSCEFEL